jgi:uncharacterized protein
MAGGAPPVGPGSAALSREGIAPSPEPLEPAERTLLLEVAREAVRSCLGRGPAPSRPTSGRLIERRGAFVTLEVRGELRGCIGTFAPSESLAGTVTRMARAAACEDPRFEPVRPEELDSLTITVSVLGPRRPFLNLEDLVVGRDGVLVQLGWRRGTLLPRVAVEEGWDALTFIERTCIKAGLDPRAWQDPEAMVELFSTEEFGESGARARPPELK